MLQRTARYIFAVLLVFGLFSETLPELHHHEADHGCVDFDGIHFDFLVHDHVHDGEQHADPLEHSGHDHLACALCLLVKGAFSSDGTGPGFPPVLQTHHLGHHLQRFDTPIAIPLPRGPPHHS